MAGKKGRSGRKPGPQKPPVRHVADYRAAGDPPADPLEAVAWAGQLLTVAMRKIATDETLDERVRRAELRSTAKVLAGLVPAERLLEAERAVRRQANAMARPEGDPGLTDVTTEPADSLRVDPA